MLNVLTPAGKEHEENARDLLIEISEKNNFDVCFFPLQSPSTVDGFLLKDDKLISVFEVKCRVASYNNGKLVFKGKEYEDYLITATKLDEGVKYAKANKLNYNVLVILRESNHMLSFKVYDYEKDEIIEHSRVVTKTQYDSTGSRHTNRLNAFIDIKLAKIINF